MSCTSMSIPTSHIAAATTTKDSNNNNGGNLHRSHSNKEICQLARLRRSHSDPQLRCSIRATSTDSKLKTSKSSVGIFHQFQISSSLLPNSVRSLLFETDEMKLVEHHSEENKGHEREEVEEHEHIHEEEREHEKRANWVERLLELRSQWKNRQPYDQTNEEEEDDYDQTNEEEDDYDHVGGCEANYDSEFEEEEVNFDRETFSKLLTRVPWSDTKLYSQLAFLCNMAYVIPEIKAENLRKYYNLHFVTSSLEKKAEAALKVKLDQASTMTNIPISSSPMNEEEVMDDYEQPKRLARPSVAYNIAASAATYVHSRAKGLLSLGYSPPSMDEDAEVERQIKTLEEYGGECSPRVYKKPEVAAYVAASTMTAVVAAEENVKLEAAKELQSLHSSPCEWFICDDPSTYTRCFIIQGSDSLASWQANLFFEPTKFEGTDVLVHRGIYEAAKGIYEQFMPEILEHLKTYGDLAKVRCIGHSLGGSLSLLVNLMLLSRGVLESSTLLPVVTFGSPSIFCGGHCILEKLGVDDNHVHSVMMHRDIVPRAFSCNYPNHVAQVLKRLNGTFRSHPCLNKNKMLYTPLGQLFILQPDEKLSPSHPLLPPGGALYALDKTQCGSQLGIKSALKAFLNSPHPLETLSDPKAYGSEGTILRDHDSSNYLKAVNGVLRQRTKLVVRRSRKERLHHLWPLLTTSQSWRHQHLENPNLVTKEVITGV